MTFGATLHKVLDGTQTQTRRPIGKRNVYLPGKVYGVQQHSSKDSIAFIKLIGVKEQMLGAVTEGNAQAEGYPSLAAFKKAWVARHGSFDPAQDVWAIEFRLVDRSELGSYDLYKFEKIREIKARSLQAKNKGP